MTDYGDPSLFYVDSEIGIFDLEDAIIEYLPETAANLMAIKSLSRSWRWGALTAFHWEGATFCKCGKHMLLNPTKLQKPNATKDAWCWNPYACADFCTCNIPKSLKNDDELQDQRIGGYPAFEFLGIDFDICHENELGDEVVDVFQKRQPNMCNVYFDSWPQDDVVAIRFMQNQPKNNDEEINNKLLERFGPRNLRLFVAGDALVSATSLKKCSKLQWLDFINAREHVNGDTMSAGVKLPQLKQLSLDYCRHIPQECFKLLRDNTSIENLSLQSIANDAIVEELSHMQSLVSLNLNSSAVSSSGIPSLVTNATRLESLDVGWCFNITPAGISTIANISSLRSLNVDGCEINATVVEELATKLSQLEVMKLTCGYLHDNAFAALGKFRSLRSLRLRGVPATITPDVFNAALSNLTQLRVLDLYNSDVKNEHLQFLEKLRSLEVLSVAWCHNVDGKGLSQMRFLSKLRKLNLGDCNRITSDGIAHLPQLTEVESLNLTGTDIDNKALRHISGMSKMRWLTLSGCSNVTDEGLQFLSNMRGLELLDLTDCKHVTATAIIRCVEKMNTLKFLMHSCSEEGTELIRRRYPDLLIHAVDEIFD